MGKVKRDERPADSIEDNEESIEDEAGFDETELEISQDDYGDDEPDDTGDKEGILAVERIMREVNVEPPKPLDLELPEGPHRILSRESKAEALRRFEEAARSKDDFDEVIGTWDKLDENRERRERYNEVLRKDAVPSPYDPMREAESIVLAAMNIGMLLSEKTGERNPERHAGICL